MNRDEKKVGLAREECNPWETKFEPNSNLNENKPCSEINVKRNREIPGNQFSH
jgi:hypothetical protein